MKIWIHKSNYRWWKYLTPKWINPITYKDAGVKIYQWLWFGYYIKK